MEEIKKITYIGNCDFIRTGNNIYWEWLEFEEGELIIGKEYDIISPCHMKMSWYKDKKGRRTLDMYGKRHLYWKIKNEKGDNIYVWEGFFEKTQNCK